MGSCAEEPRTRWRWWHAAADGWYGRECCRRTLWAPRRNDSTDALHAIRGASAAARASSGARPDACCASAASRVSLDEPSVPWRPSRSAATATARATPDEKIVPRAAGKCASVEYRDSLARYLQTVSGLARPCLPSALTHKQLAHRRYIREGSERRLARLGGLASPTTKSDYRHTCGGARGIVLYVECGKY